MSVGERVGMAVAPAAPVDAWRPVLVVMAAALAGLLIAHAATVGTFVATWSQSALYRTAWLVLPVFSALVWMNRHRFASPAPVPSAWGVAAAAIAASLWIAADVVNVAEGRQTALVAAAVAVVWAALGWRSLRSLLPFLALLVFLVPSGRFLLAPLKHVAVFLVQGVGSVVGLTVETATFVLYVEGRRYVVIDECAGLPFVWIGLFLGLVFGLLLYRTPWRIAALTLAGGVLGILANGLRIISILATDSMMETQMDLASHMPYGWATLGLTVCLMLGLVAMLRPEAPEAHGRGGPAAMVRPPRSALLWPVFAAAVAASAPHLSPGATDVPYAGEATTSLPAELEGWTATAGDVDWTPVARGRVTPVVAAYRRGSATVSVFVVEAATTRAKVSGGAVDLIGDGDWMTASQRRRDACAVDRCLRAEHLRLVLKKTERIRHVYTAYAIGDRLVASPVTLRLLRGLFSLRSEPPRARLIAVATDDPAGLSETDVVELLEAIVRAGD